MLVSQATYVKTKFAAEILGVSVSTLEKWRAAGKGPAYRRFGPKTLRYARADLDAFADEMSAA